MTDGRGMGETVNDGTSVGVGRGTEMEGVGDRECHWKGPEGPGRDEGGRRGHRVVGGRDDGLEPKGGVGPGGRSITTGLGRKPEGGCYSAEMRRPAIRSTAHDPCPIRLNGVIQQVRVLLLGNIAGRGSKLTDNCLFVIKRKMIEETTKLIQVKYTVMSPEQC